MSAAIFDRQRATVFDRRLHPELLQASFRDDAHLLLLVSASDRIVVRKSRTVKATVRETRTNWLAEAEWSRDDLSAKRNRPS
jgi:hypothetical protein